MNKSFRNVSLFLANQKENPDTPVSELEKSFNLSFFVSNEDLALIDTWEFNVLDIKDVAQKCRLAWLMFGNNGFLDGVEDGKFIKFIGEC